MAIWQYRGEFIPELWLIAEHGQIPDTLENYFMTEGSDLDAIEDPHCWKEADVPTDIVAQ